MAFNSIVDSQIEASEVSAGRADFTNAMLVAYHTKTSDLVVTVASSAQLIADHGFSRSNQTDSVILAKVDQFFSQVPKPRQLKIGRRSTATTWVYTLTVLAVAEDDRVAITFNGTEIEEIVASGDDNEDVAGDLATAINTAAGSSVAAAVGAVVTITAASAGLLYRLADWTRNIEVKSAGTDSSIASDLDAIFAEDPGFRVFDLANDSEVSVLAAASWAETNGVAFLPTLVDTDVRKSSVSNDAASDLESFNYDFTFPHWHGRDTADGRGLALFGSVAAFYEPGAATFAHKGIAATRADTSDTLRVPGETAVLEGKTCNFYAPYRGVDTAWNGRCSSGEYFDIILGKLWLNDEIEATLFEVMRGYPGKLGMTEESLDVLRNALEEVLKRAASDRYKLLVPGSSEITFKPVSELTPTERRSRVYGYIEWSALFQGAIHESVVRGRVGF